MSYYVYILESESDHTYYKGSTSDIERRLKEHNSGLSRYTSTRMPWKLVYLEEFPTKREALIMERKLKHKNAQSLQYLLKQYAASSAG